MLILFSFLVLRTNFFSCTDLNCFYFLSAKICMRPVSLARSVLYLFSFDSIERNSHTYSANFM